MNMLSTSLPSPDTDNSPEVAPTMPIAQKKLAIEGALSAYLSPDILAEAVRIWEEKYSVQPTFALQRFLNEFCHGNHVLRAQRSQILQSLLRALSGADGRPLETSRFPAARKPAFENVAVQCCTMLIESLFDRAPGDMQVKMRLYMLDHLPAMRLPQGPHRALYAWLSQQYRVPTDIVVAPETLRHLVNLAYVALCEFIGPVKADKLLHDAVVFTELHFDDYPARRLL
jgi:hypothetical protein